MNKMFLYPKLAASGIKNNRRTYLPYILTCSGMIMMFYIVAFLQRNRFVAEMKGGDKMQVLLGFGVVVMIVFSSIFMFYTNSFLIRGRKKEFGLYNILGMGKRNIARILIWETVFVYLSSLLVGNVCGIIFSKLAELFLVHIMKEDVGYGFAPDFGAVRLAALWYAIIFLLILFNTLRQIRLTNPIELMKSESTGEKPPKSNLFLTVPGVLLLGGAYYMAVTIKNPLGAIFAFLIAVIMVIFATYMLFIAGSVVICRILQKNKSYYYKTNHFVSVSSMVYRMKRNGAGLASICILSTMVLVTLSSTICLYAGEDKMLRERYPRDIVLHTYDVDEKYTSVTHGAAENALAKFGETPENILNYSFLCLSSGTQKNMIYLSPEKRDEADNFEHEIRQLYFITIDDYNRITGNNVTLGDGEVVINTTDKRFKYDTVNIYEYGEFSVKAYDEDFAENGVDSSMIGVGRPLYFFVKDRTVIDELCALQNEIYSGAVTTVRDYYGFDLSCDEEKQIEIYEEIFFPIAQYQKDLSDAGKEDEWCGCRIESKANNKFEFFAIYGGLFFLGIIFGTVFIVAAALIMYYKQISEGYEDKARFDILQKVGMTKREIKKSINSQVLTVFFLPLVSAGIHMTFAFPIVSRLLMLFGLTDTAFFAVVTLLCFGVFSAVYILVYIITSHSYYNIVQQG